MRTALVLALFSLQGDGVRLAPNWSAEEAVRVRWRVDATSRSIDESWVPVVGGTRLVRDGGSIGGGEVVTIELGAVMLDEIDGVRDGRVQYARRTYEDIGGRAVMSRAVMSDESEEGAKPTRHALWSPLDGRRVAFEPGRKRFIDDEGEAPDDDLLLGGLHVDTHGGWFLPSKGVSVGDEWKLPASAWDDFTNLGGETWIDHASAWPPGEEDARLHAERREQAARNAEGEVVCTLTELREEGSVTLAHVAIAVDVETESRVEFVELTDEGEMSVVESIEDRTTATGTLVWDLDRGRPRSIRFDARVVDTTVRLETFEDGVSRSGVEWTTDSETEAAMSIVYEAAPFRAKR